MDCDIKFKLEGSVIFLLMLVCIMQIVIKCYPLEKNDYSGFRKSRVKMMQATPTMGQFCPRINLPAV